METYYLWEIQVGSGTGPVCKVIALNDKQAREKVEHVTSLPTWQILGFVEYFHRDNRDVLERMATSVEKLLELAKKGE